MISFIKNRIEHDEIKPVIDSVYSFDEMVKAHCRVDTGRKIGDVIVDVTSVASN